MTRRFPGLELLLIESGGDNLAATFSPELADLTIYVIDVAGGEKIPRKGGPGITRSDLLVINKTDLAPIVGADLGVMEADTRRMRGERPFVMANLRGGVGTVQVIDFIARAGGLALARRLRRGSSRLRLSAGGMNLVRFLTRSRRCSPSASTRPRPGSPADPGRGARRGGGHHQPQPPGCPPRTSHPAA